MTPRQRAEHVTSDYGYPELTHLRELVEKAIQAAIEDERRKWMDAATPCPKCGAQRGAIWAIVNNDFRIAGYCARCPMVEIST